MKFKSFGCETAENVDSNHERPSATDTSNGHPQSRVKERSFREECGLWDPKLLALPSCNYDLASMSTESDRKPVTPCSPDRQNRGSCFI